MKNKDIYEWLLDEGIDSLTTIVNMKGESLFIVDVLEKHLKEQLLQRAVSGSLPLIEFIEEIEYMMKLYGNQRYTQAESQRDKLAEKLDDIMRLGGNDR